MNTASVSSGIPEFGACHPTGEPAKNPQTSSSEGNQFASQMRALWDTQGASPATESEAAATPEKGLNATDALLSKPGELPADFFSAVVNSLRQGVHQEAQSRPPFGSQAGQNPQSTTEKPDTEQASAETPVAAEAVEELTPIDVDSLIPAGSPKSGKRARLVDVAALEPPPSATQVAVPPVAPTPIASTPAVTTPALDGAAAAPPALSFGQPMPAIARPALRIPAGAVSDAMRSNVQSSGREEILADTAAPLQPKDAAEVDAGLAFAARLNQGSGMLANDAKTSFVQAASDSYGPARGAAATSSSTVEPQQQPDLTKTTPAAISNEEDKVRAANDADSGPRSNAASNAAMVANSSKSDVETSPVAQKQVPATQASSAPELVKEVDQPAHLQPVRDISIRVATDTSQTADVRMQERNGAIQVTVRTSDPALNGSLRSNLDNLVNNLSLDGTSTEVWHPGLPAQPGANTDSRHGQPGDSSSYYQGADQRFQQSGEQGRGREGRPKPEWLEEFE